VETLRALGAFFSAVFKHWATLLTGGAAMAVLGLYEHYVGGSVPWSAYAGLVALFFLAACFLAFRDQYILANRAQADLSNAVSAANKLRFASEALEELRTTYKATKGELENLKARIGEPFPFDAAQRKVFIDYLVGVPVERRFEVMVDYPGFGSGPGPAKALARALQDAGWEASARATIVNPNLRGINISMAPTVVEGRTAPPRKAALIMNALNKAGMTYAKAVPSVEEGDPDYFQLIVAEP
jgi:hypothetical protein